MKKTGTEKFISFVNGNLGKSLLTTGISSRTRVHIRTVQMYCKSLRERQPKKVSWAASPAKGRTRSISYTFKRPISISDIQG